MDTLIMDALQSRLVVEDECSGVSEEIWLLGQPPLEDYLDFVRDMAVGGAAMRPAALVDEWRTANDYYQELEEREAGIADEIECRELDPALQRLATEVTADPRFRNSFDVLPTSFEIVELDRLVLFQTHVSGEFIQDLRCRLGPAPDPEALFRFCFPLGHAHPPVKIRQVGSQRYALSSESMDFRFHQVVLLHPHEVSGYHSFGMIAGIVGVVVGFSSNFLSAVRYGNRLVLHNGYHRACALRALGITHAPCVIETATRRDELNVAAKQRVADDPGFYLKAARPPLLKDFFDPKIRKVWKTHKTMRTIEVSFEVRDFNVRQ